MDPRIQSMNRKLPFLYGQHNKENVPVSVVVLPENNEAVEAAVMLYAEDRVGGCGIMPKCYGSTYFNYPVSDNCKIGIADC